MTDTAEKSDPALWEQVKKRVQDGNKGGKPGQWSARKAQLAVHDYKAAGGDYRGPKTADNHLTEWTREDWGTKSGEESGQTGERYLPKKTRETLSDGDYKRSSAKKRADTRKGKQFSAQPKDIALKTADIRLESLTVAELRKRASSASINGRSRMSKAELVHALSKSD